MPVARGTYTRGAILDVSTVVKPIFIAPTGHAHTYIHIYIYLYIYIVGIYFDITKFAFMRPTHDTMVSIFLKE